MNERLRNIIVGLTTITGGVGLISLLLLFGYVPEFIENGYEVKIRMANAGGVLPGNRVLYQGLDVGQIKTVQQVPGLSSGVELVALINEKQQIPKGATVRVSRPALGGSPSIEFVAPETPTDVALPRNGEAIVDGSVTSPFKELGKSVRNSIDGLVDQLTGEKGSLSQFNNLAAEWTQVGKNINELTQQLNLKDVDEGKINGNLASVLARVDSAVRKMDQALDGVNAYLYDEELKKQIKSTVANTERATDNLAKWSDNVDDISDEITGSIEELKQAYVKVADELSVFIDNGNKLVNAANQGNGTIGMLIKNPQLYKNLNDASERLNKALDDVRLLVEKWKTEGVPIQF